MQFAVATPMFYFLCLTQFAVAMGWMRFYEARNWNWWVLYTNDGWGKVVVTSGLQSENTGWMFGLNGMTVVYLEDPTGAGRRFQCTNTGFCETLLQGLLATFDVTITNDNDDDNNMRNMDNWTFESARGRRRRINVSMCTQETRFISAHAACNLDFGSDHHAMTVSFG